MFLSRPILSRPLQPGLVRPADAENTSTLLMRARLPSGISDRDIGSKAARQATSFSFPPACRERQYRVGLHSSVASPSSSAGTIDIYVGLGGCAQYKQCHITQSNLPINQLIFAHQSQPALIPCLRHFSLFVCLQILYFHCNSMEHRYQHPT